MKGAYNLLKVWRMYLKLAEIMEVEEKERVGIGLRDDPVFNVN